MNPYEVLGVSPAASDEELSRAYKTLAKRYHPDLNPGDGAAAKKMGEINRAYDDVRAMRQRGEAGYDTGYGTGYGTGYDAGYGTGYSTGYGPRYGGTGYGRAGYGRPASGGFWEEPFEVFRRGYAARRPRRSPVGAILFVFTVMLLVRLLLSFLFGGYVYPYAYTDTGQGTEVQPGRPGYYEIYPGAYDPAGGAQAAP